jgi:DeoR family glycerol-3-phosphate regulon repressor
VHVFGADGLDTLVTDAAPAAGLSRVLAGAGVDVICASPAADDTNEEVV